MRVALFLEECGIVAVVAWRRALPVQGEEVEAVARAMEGPLKNALQPLGLSAWKATVVS